MCATHRVREQSRHSLASVHFGANGCRRWSFPTLFFEYLSRKWNVWSKRKLEGERKASSPRLIEAGVSAIANHGLCFSPSAISLGMGKCGVEVVYATRRHFLTSVLKRFRGAESRCSFPFSQQFKNQGSWLTMYCYFFTNRTGRGHKQIGPKSTMGPRPRQWRTLRS